MSYDSAISALSNDALKFVKDNYVIGLGSGRAAKEKKFNIIGVPTSLQIKLIAEKEGILVVESDQVDHIDIA